MLSAIRHDLIVIPEDRFRKAFDEAALRELKGSIERNGLLHAIVVETADHSETGDITLRAGERRLRAMRELIAEGKPITYGAEPLPAGHVPCLEMVDLTELERLEIEVEENVVRKDFTWQERNRALAALHKLRCAQNPGQTFGDTASEILGKPAVGDQRMVVSDALIIEKHLDDPEVAKAKNEREALKTIRKKTEAIHRARLALKFDRTTVKHNLLFGDALEHLARLPSESFDVILTDPPYGIDAHQFGEMSGTGHEYTDNYSYWKSLMVACTEAFERVAKPRAHCYIFCDIRRFEELKALMVLANWTVFQTPLIWYKGNHGMLPWPKHGPRRTYEAILYAWKGERETLCLKSDVIVTVPAVEKLLHGAQKPVALYCELLSRSVSAGDTALDCFGGTGPMLVAANRMGLTATYIEKDEAPYNIALARANQEDIDDGAEELDGLHDVAL